MEVNRHLCSQVIIIRELSRQKPTPSATLAQAKHKLGTLHLERFELDWNKADIKAALRYFKQASVYLKQAPDPTEIAKLHHSFGTAQSRRFGTYGEESDLEEAHKHLETALSIANSRDVAELVIKIKTSLGYVHYRKFRYYGKRADIDNAVDYFRTALNFYDAGGRDLGAERAAVQNYLGISLSSRFSSFGREADLIESIACHTDAYKFYQFLSPPLPAKEAFSLRGLGVAHARHFRTFRQKKDINQAITYFQQALKIEGITDYYVEYAFINNYLGTAYMRRFREYGLMADMDAARQCHEEALRLFTKERHPIDHADTLSRLGIDYARQFKSFSKKEDVDKALECQKEALAIFGSAKTFSCANVHANYGTALSRRYDYYDDPEDARQAIEQHRRAIAILTKLKHPVRLAYALNKLGIVLFARARHRHSDNLETDLDQAIQNFRKALKIYNQFSLPIHAGETRNYLGEALVHRSQIGLDQHPPLTPSLRKVFQQIHFRGIKKYLREAIEHHEKALLLFDNSDKHPIYCATTNRLLAFAFQQQARLEGTAEQDQRLNQACNRLNTAIALFTQRGYVVQQAECQHLLANILLARFEVVGGAERVGLLNSAKANYNAALKIYKDTGSYERAFKVASEMKQNYLQTAERLKISQIYNGIIENDQFDQLAKQSTDLALDAQITLLQLIDGRMLNQFEEGKSTNFLKKNRRHYEEAIDMILHYDPAELNYKQKWLAFALSEEIKARRLYFQLQQNLLTDQFLLPARAPAEVQAEYSRCLEVWQQRRREVQHNAQYGTITPELQEEYRLCLQHFRAYLPKVAETDQLFAANLLNLGEAEQPYQFLENKVQELAQTLGANTALVAHHLNDKAIVTFLIIGGKQAKVELIDPLDDFDVVGLERLAMQWNLASDHFERYKDKPQSYRAFHPKVTTDKETVLEDLATKLYRPIIERLLHHDIKRVVLVPSQKMHQFSLPLLPLTAMGQPNLTSCWHQYTFRKSAFPIERLQEAFEVTCSPSAWVWQICQQHNYAKEDLPLDLLAMAGNRDDNLVWAEAEVHSIEDILRISLEELAPKPPKFKTKPSADETGREFKRRILTLTHPDQVTKQNFMQLAPKTRNIHLALHGRGSHQSAEEVCILFHPTRAEGDDLNSAQLTYRELLTLVLYTDLFMATACSWGKVELDNVDEYLGATFALLNAGVRSIITPLWDVQEVAALLLSERFYKNLTERFMSKAAALAESGHWLRNLSHAELAEQLNDEKLRAWAEKQTSLPYAPAEVSGDEMPEFSFLKAQRDAILKSPDLLPFKLLEWGALFLVGSGWNEKKFLF
jgi:CHAT domain-containing protein/tetratricopeptide (TPR) repeat protein